MRAFFDNHSIARRPAAKQQLRVRGRMRSPSLSDDEFCGSDNDKAFMFSENNNWYGLQLAVVVLAGCILAHLT